MRAYGVHTVDLYSAEVAEIRELFIKLAVRAALRLWHSVARRGAAPACRGGQVWLHSLLWKRLSKPCSKLTELPGVSKCRFE